MLEVICIDEVNGQFFLVTKVGDLVTLRLPINAEIAEALLKIGIPRCTS